jgi:hypothetical protein
MTDPLVSWLAHEVFNVGWSATLRQLMQKRSETARDILQTQLSKADISIADASDKDEAVAMVFEYIEAARQGAGRRNLRMLAEIMAGKLATPPIYASEFLRWSRLLADLSPEEIIALARLHVAWSDDRWRKADGNKDPHRVAVHLQEVLVKEGAARNIADVYSILGALQRTGLVVYSASAFHSAHVPTPRLDELLQLITIEEVIAEPDR